MATDTSPQRVPTRSRLRLYFSIGLLIVVVASTVALGFVFRYVSSQNLLAYGEESNLALVHDLSTTIGPRLAPLLATAAPALTNEKLQTHPVIKQALKVIGDYTRASAVVRVRVYDSRGRIALSTHAPDMGGTESGVPVAEVVRTGRTVSQMVLKPGGGGSGESAPKQAQCLVSTFTQLRQMVNGDVGTVGVFQVDRDVCPLHAGILRTQNTLYMATIAVMVALYGGLFIVVAMAERRIKSAEREGSAYQNKLEEQNQLLQSLTNDLTKTRDQALDASKAKSAFLANMSHELRTPLNAVIGYTELMMEDGSEKTSRQALLLDIQKVNAAGKHLLSLINHILDLSKVEAGKMEYRVESFAVAPLICEAIASVDSLLRQNQNELVLDIDEHTGTMDSDVTKVHQIFFNLIGNANKFTQSGTIVVRLRREKGDDGREWIIISVADTGIGMTEEQMTHLFTPFTQVDSSTTRRYGGSGLGLAISRQLCRLLGGDLTAFSQVNKGSTFVAKLPAVTVRACAATDTDGLKTGPKVNAASIRFDVPIGSNEKRSHVSTVLAIDDDAKVRDLLERFLTRQGFYAYTAADAYQGLELARQIRPDVITLDVMMPEKDGWWVLTQLKRDPNLCDIPVIMLTMVADRELGYTLGVADFLSKPVSSQKLAEMLARHVRLPQAILLVVQYDADNRKSIRGLLEEQGVRVVTAADVKEAFDTLYNVTPQLIIADLASDAGDELTFLDKLKRDETWNSIPVVLTVGENIAPSRAEALNENMKLLLRRRANSSGNFLEELRNQLIQQVRAYKAGAIGNVGGQMPAEPVQKSVEKSETQS